MTRRTSAVAKRVARFYLESGDYNGMPLSHALAGRTTMRSIEAALAAGEIEVLGSKHDLNTHVKRFGVRSQEEQVEALRDADPHHTCLYPSRSHQERTINQAEYADRPYALELALGAAQLSYRSFDLSVLEWYRNDPRYTYHCGATRGFISIGDEHYASDATPERDKVLLESFGFSFSEQFERAVAVFVCYLARLSPEHQRVWKARERGGVHRLHPAYYRTAILGEWPKELPIFSAFFMEQKVINQIAQAMGRPLLFRDVPAEMELSGFSFLLRPTLRELDAFTHLLDKLLSDNINKKFFLSDVDDEIEEVRSDGKVVVRPRGTLQMLDAWVRAKFRTDDWEPWNAAYATLREVRKHRQQPAHTIRDDVFDPKYLKEQRKLMIDAYNAVRTIRLVLQNHPAARDVDIIEELREGKICDY